MALHDETELQLPEEEDVPEEEKPFEQDIEELEVEAPTSDANYQDSAIIRDLRAGIKRVAGVPSNTDTGNEGELRIDSTNKDMYMFLASAWTKIGGVSVQAGGADTYSSTGDKATTGVGFTPKVVFIFATDQSQLASWGFSSGTGTTDNVVLHFTDTAYLAQNNRVIFLEDSGATFESRAKLTSFDSDGFTFNVSTHTSGTVAFVWLAIG